jgi:hypothetical protein
MGQRLPAAAANDIVTFSPDKSEVGALALITYDPEKYAAEVYQPFADRLTTAIDSVKTINYDIKTTAGMAVAVKARATFRDLRVKAEKVREARKAPIIKIGKLLQSGYAGLEARITPLEELFDEDIQTETKRKAEVKAEADRVEAVRVAAIRAKIAEIVGIPAKHAASTSAELTSVLQVLATREVERDEFAELTNEARTAVEYVAVELMALRDSVKARELAEEQRLAAIEAESKRIEAERAELAELRAAAAETARLAAIENERIANEQAIEAKRLADLAAAQEAAAAALRVKADANLRAEREAQETAMRLERERNAAEQAKAAANLKAAQDALAAQVAAHEAAVKLEADHAEALEMNATIDADRHARAQAMVDQAIADAAAMPATLNELMAATLPLPESVSEHDAMVDAGFDEGPSDNEIIDAVMATFGWSYDEATKRLTTIDCAAAWAERVEMEA